jgi:putative FmdB family regulatory protein
LLDLAETAAHCLTIAAKTMPTYEYTCEKCGKNFDAFQSMRDEPYRICPKELCRQAKWGKGKVKRLLGTGAGLIFKGSGFYITDYRSESYKNAAKKESSSAGDKAGGKTGSEGKTEAKPAPAAAKKPEKPTRKESDP